MTKLVCPECGKDNGLWQGATWDGWVTLSADGTTPTGWTRPDGRDADVEGDFVLDNSQFGCGECGWEGSRKSDLYRCTCNEYGGRHQPECKRFVPNPNQEALL